MGSAQQCAAGGIGRLEAWQLLDGGAASERGGWALQLADDVEVSEGLIVYLRHYLASHDDDAIGREEAAEGVKLLGIALGSRPVAGGVDSRGSGKQLWQRQPCACGTVYRAAAWTALRAFAASLPDAAQLLGTGSCPAPPPPPAAGGGRSSGRSCGAATAAAARHRYSAARRRMAGGRSASWRSEATRPST